MKLKKISWDELISMLLSMAKELKGREIDVVIGVGVSGLIPAVILRKLLGVGEFYVMTVRHYSDEKPPRVIAKDPIVVQAPSADVVKGKRVLVIDDFAHTGKTLELIKNFLINSGALEVITAVVIKRGKHASVDVYGAYVDHCVLFPWESL